MKQYFIKKGDTTTESVNTLIPFSLRQLPESIATHNLMNDFTILCFTMGMYENFGDCINAISKKTKAMKTSIYPQGVLALTEVIAMIPAIFGQLVMMWVVSKATLLMSNVPGCKKVMNFGGAKCKGVLGLIPGLGDLAFGISIFSHGDQVILAIQADESYVKNPKEIRFRRYELRQTCCAN